MVVAEIPQTIFPKFFYRVVGYVINKWHLFTVMEAILLVVWWLVPVEPTGMLVVAYIHVSIHLIDYDVCGGVYTTSTDLGLGPPTPPPPPTTTTNTTTTTG